MSNDAGQKAGTGQKWLKWPGPGEFRGEGRWERIEDLDCSEEAWQNYRDRGFLPTYEGEAPPPED